MSRLYYKIIARDRKFYHVPIYLFLRALSIIYKSAVRFRLWCYGSGLLSAQKLDCRVISVGNLTLGGTGKTPMVMLIAETLRRHGRQPAILSRGYKGNSTQDINVVCDGQRILLSPETAGDEPVMMARRLKNIPVLTGRNRYRTGRYALERLGADTLILDDGFQHLGLHRDLNILLLDHRNPFGNGVLFPAGNLREPLTEIRRADIICVTRHTAEQENPEIDPAIEANVPIIKTNFHLKSVVRLDTGEEFDAKYLQHQNVAAFCGIAKPEDFRNILEQSQARVVFYRAFPDHHVYSPDDQKAIEKGALRAGAKFILTTEKDAVKLDNRSFGLPVLKVSIDLEIVEGLEVFNKHILNQNEE